ncbi:MAG TPA: site-specific integrase [Candidatus Pygmaiobacter gallistercoris]|nr:site-specific integrase [Candidatus Pygmaiobacter gallistercoris]
MASIIKRKKNYSVVYTYVDENGKTKQKWETRSSYQDALKRKAEIENQKSSHSFLPPADQTISEFMSDFVTLYGEKRWGVSMYDSQNALIANYINPIIGEMKVQEVTPRVVDKYIQTLQKTPAVNTKMRRAKTEFVTSATIEKIIKLLRCAFKQAVRWELVAKNPFDNVVLPKVEYKRREIWTADMIRTALDQCTDGKLYVAMNLSFACSLRIGEILGLTWENVHISDDEIGMDNAYVYIDKELARASKRAIEMIGKRDIYHIFPPLLPNTSTRIILKKPKTNSSIRKVWLPRTVAYILREWKKSQDELRALLGEEYQDYDLVVALSNGRPCEDRVILKSFEKLREAAGLPRVVFHSLRHSSTTYKLKLNHGDLKATQGDTGHAQIDMITNVYAHILDEDRKVNAQKFEDAFYACANPDLRGVHPPEPKKEPEKEPEPAPATAPATAAPAPLDLAGLLEQLSKSPELISVLAALAAAVPSKK